MKLKNEYLLNLGETEGGGYFVSNYPPYQFWSKDPVDTIRNHLFQLETSAADLGLYVHIPFCRKRCRFCYFKVYTDKSPDEISLYVEALKKELIAYGKLTAVASRPLRFLYFGGGTPSYLSTKQMEEIFVCIKENFNCQSLEEFTFECEPGTLSTRKLDVLKNAGVTRLSLGVENFTDSILELNGRAHKSKEIYRAYQYAKDLGYQNINIDLISGMIGETDENWSYNIQETIALDPDSVTIYQMEIPYNTKIYKEMQESCQDAPVANWEFKQKWVSEAYQKLGANGYQIGSAYTLVKNNVKFIYRDALWNGADLMGTGVASFSHFAGTHYQNENKLEDYIARVNQGELPLARGYLPSEDEMMRRQFLLNLKIGKYDFSDLDEKYGVNILELFTEEFSLLSDLGFLTVKNKEINLTEKGLLNVDRILASFFLEKHVDPNWRA